MTSATGAPMHSALLSCLRRGGDERVSIGLMPRSEFPIRLIDLPTKRQRGDVGQCSDHLRWGPAIPAFMLVPEGDKITALTTLCRNLAIPCTIRGYMPS